MMSKLFREKWGLDVNEIHSTLMIKYDTGSRPGVERRVTLHKFIMPGYVILHEYGKLTKYTLANISGVRKAEFCMTLIAFA